MIKTKLFKIVRNIIIVSALLLIYSLLEPYWIQVKEITITNKNIPAAFNGTKIVYIADIHHSEYFSLARVKNLVRQVNGLKPDIILLGGDYVTSSSKYIIPCFDEFKNLEAPLGKFGVLGNHDHWEGAELSRSSMAKAGITLLDNKATWIIKDGKRIKIGGVGDLWDDKQDIIPATRELTENDFTILLSHNPDYVEQITDKRISLVLSGHTHGGQVTLFGFWGPFTPSAYGEKYRKGLVKTQSTQVLVSNGIGPVGYPLRFFARPQINVIYLNECS